MKHTKIPLLLLLILLTLSFLQMPKAQAINITTTADSWTDPIIDVNHGSDTYLSIRPITRGYLKFPLTSIPSGATIDSAKVWLYYWSGFGGDIIYVNFVSTDSWLENTILWSNQPAYSTQLDTVTVNAIQWYSWTVTSQVQTENNGDDTLSIAVRNPSGTDSSFYSKEGTYPPYLEVSYHNTPVNDQLTLTNPSIGSQGVLANKQAYAFTAKVTDNDGGTDINYVDLTLDQNGENLRFRWTESTDTFSEEFDPLGYVSISSTSADSTLVGNQWTLVFKITFDWDYPDQGLHICRLYSIDDASYSDTDNYNDVYYVVRRLVSASLSVSDTRVNPSQSLTFSGYWYYEGTSIYPPDGNYNVKVKLAAVEKGTDTSLISGAFSIPSITAEATVASYAYTTTADYMVTAGSFPSVIVDKIAMTISASKNTPALNETVTFTVSGKYAYDNTPVSTLSFQITRNGSNYSTTTPFTDMQSTFVLYNYTTSSASETTYTLNTFTTNTQNVGWGYSYALYGAYNENGIRSGAINVTFYRHNQASQNILLDGTYTFQSADYLGSVFQFNLGYNTSRTYYLRLPSEDIYVFEPNSPYYTYFFTVIDMAGIHNGYLESIINVNGTDRVVERWSLVVLNNIPFTMEWSRAYTMKLICDEGTYVFGTFVAGAQTSFQLPVYKALFPQDLVAVEGVYINALRINDTRIQMNYTDSLLKTNWVQVSIYQLPAKQLAYTTNNTGQTQMINWDLANPKADYWVVVTVSSQQFGSNTWQFVLSSILSNENPWDALNWLGTSPFPLSQIFGFGIVLLIFGVFSQEHAAMAGIVGVLVAAILTVIGMLSIAASWLAVTMGIAILVAISINRKRAEAG